MARKLNWSPGDHRFGFGVTAELKNQTGRLLDKKTEYGLIADNPYQVGHKGHVAFRSWRPDTVNASYMQGAQNVSEVLAQHRKRYKPITEIWKLPPSTGAKWVLDQEKWMGDINPVYRIRRKTVNAFIEACHNNGIAVVPYMNQALKGYHGAELMRKHPEWLHYEADGSPAKYLDSETLQLTRQFYENYPESLENDKLLKRLRPKEDGITGHPNPMNEEVVDYVLEEFIQAMKAFNLDGFRWDARPGYALSNRPANPQSWYNYKGEPRPDREEQDRVSARNIRRWEQEIREKCPDAVFGYNWGVSYEKGGAAFPKTYAETAKRGSMILWENLCHIHRPSHRLHRWKDFADALG